MLGAALLQSLADLWADPVLRKATWIALTWLLIIAVSALATRFFDRIDDRLTAYGVPERRLAKLDFLVHLFLIVIAVLVTLFLLGIGQALWGAVAVTSVAGVILALAAQQLAKNLLAGMVILFERPFIAGDLIDVDGRRGTVEKVTLHSTTLEDPDGLRLIVPNSRILETAITNFTTNPHRRLVLRIDVEESVELERVRAVLFEAIATEEHLVRPREVVVFAQESLDEGVRFEVRYWVERVRYGDHCLPSAMGRLLDALATAGLSTAKPAQHVYVTESRPGG